MIQIGSEQYKVAVSAELDGLTERLYSLHHGCVDYVEWHAQKNPALRRLLAEFPIVIEWSIGMVPVPAVAAMVDLYYKLHQALYQSWPDPAGKAVPS